MRKYIVSDNTAKQELDDDVQGNRSDNDEPRYHRRRIVTAEELLASYDGEFIPSEEPDWGPDVGAEIIEW
jgi:hypothetical protein